WIRDVEDTNAKPLSGAEDPGGIFWAPDNERLAFFSQQSLKVVDVHDGDVRTLAPAPGSTSGSWSQSGDILIDSSEGGGLFRISAATGTRTRVTSPDRSTGERHFQPQFLPDGERYLFLIKTSQPSTTGIYLGSLYFKEYRFLTSSSSKALYSAPERIFF